MCFLRSKEVILPRFQTVMFIEAPLKHAAIECCSPCKLAPGESIIYSLFPAYKRLDRDRVTTAVSWFMSVPSGHSLSKWMTVSIPDCIYNSKWGSHVSHVLWLCSYLKDNSTWVIFSQSWSLIKTLYSPSEVLSSVNSATTIKRGLMGQETWACRWTYVF